MPKAGRYPGAVLSVPVSCSWLIWIKAGFRGWFKIINIMEHRAQFLRLQISLYRRYLADGAVEVLTKRYLAEIMKAELELAEIEKDSRKSSLHMLAT